MVWTLRRGARQWTGNPASLPAHLLQAHLPALRRIPAPGCASLSLALVLQPTSPPGAGYSNQVCPCTCSYSAAAAAAASLASTCATAIDSACLASASAKYASACACVAAAAASAAAAVAPAAADAVALALPLAFAACCLIASVASVTVPVSRLRRSQISDPRSQVSDAACLDAFCSHTGASPAMGILW